MLPEFSLGPFVSLPTYYLYLSLLISCMYGVTWRWAVHQHQDTALALNLALLITISGFLGGRLFHVFYEAPSYYALFPGAVFRFWQGGYVFYGGLLSSAFSVWVYLLWKKQSFWGWFDFLAPVLALSYAWGRLACFLAGCCYGRYCDWPWAVGGRHPAPLYALLGESLISLFLFVWSSRKPSLRTGTIALSWLGLHALNRLIMESYREDFRGSLIAGLSIATWMSLLILAFATARLAGLYAPSLLKRR